VGVISDLRRLRGRETPIFRGPPPLPEDEAESARDLSRRAADDDPRPFARGVVVALAGGITLWGLIAACIWFLW
jgi:hypothetical protein